MQLLNMNKKDLNKNPPPSKFLNLTELHLFFLLPFGLEIFLLLNSTIYFFLEGGTQTPSSSSQASSTFETLTKFFQTGTEKNSWYLGKHLKTMQIIYRLFMGMAFILYFKFFKSGLNSEVLEKEKKKNISDYQLWFLSSLFFPTFFSLLEIWSPSQSSKKEENISEWATIVAVVLTALQFSTYYMYMKSSFQTLSSHFKHLFSDKEDNFDSTSLNFFASSIFMTLVMDVAISAGTFLILKSIFPVKTTENQAKLEKENYFSMILKTLLLAPMMEELVYSSSMIKPSNFHYSMIAVSSFMFALQHVDESKETIFHLLPYLVGGAVFALSYKKFKNIWMPMLVHLLHNLLALFVMILK